MNQLLQPFSLSSRHQMYKFDEDSDNGKQYWAKDFAGYTFDHQHYVHLINTYDFRNGLEETSLPRSGSNTVEQLATFLTGVLVELASLF